MTWAARFALWFWRGRSPFRCGWASGTQLDSQVEKVNVIGLQRLFEPEPVDVTYLTQEKRLNLDTLARVPRVDRRHHQLGIGDDDLDRRGEDSQCGCSQAI